MGLHACSSAQLQRAAIAPFGTRPSLARCDLRTRRARASVSAMAGAPTQLWALDFDGVACDSCGESSLSAWKAASALWPEIFNSPDALARKDQLIEDMRAVRPVVETGYENIVQIRCLLEGVTVNEMLEGWSTILPAYMKKWALDRAEMVDLFGTTRDHWIATDLEGWLAPNRIYPGVADCMNALMTDHEVYIVTTKQARFTETILNQMAGIPFPADRIFSQTVSGRPKSEVLEGLHAAHPEAESFHFVEDKMSTLEKVAKLNALKDWKLYLVDWGYNTAAERARAVANPRISVIDISGFKELSGLKK